MLLRDNSYLSSGCPGKRNAHLPYQTRLQDPAGPYANLKSFRVARYRQALRNETIRMQDSGDEVPPYRNPRYLRLVDGGVADNSGLTSMRRALLATGAPADIGRLVSQGRLQHLVVIAVNARSDPKSDLDNSTRYTTVLTMANGISGSLVDNASANAAAVFQDFIKLLIDDRDTLVREGQTAGELRGVSDLDRFRSIADRDRGAAAAAATGEVHRHQLDIEAGRRSPFERGCR